MRWKAGSQLLRFLCRALGGLEIAINGRPVIERDPRRQGL